MCLHASAGREAHLFAHFAVSRLTIVPLPCGVPLLAQAGNLLPVRLGENILFAGLLLQNLLQQQMPELLQSDGIRHVSAHGGDAAAHGGDALARIFS